MNSYYITFRSITYAQRAEAAVRRSGIGCALQRTPKWMEERGCGYCLHLRQGDVGPALLLLQENGIPFRKVYRQRGDGTLEALEA